jgi:hypothetical protein
VDGVEPTSWVSCDSTIVAGKNGYVVAANSGVDGYKHNSLSNRVARHRVMAILYYPNGIII